MVLVSNLMLCLTECTVSYFILEERGQCAFIFFFQTFGVHGLFKLSTEICICCRCFYIYGINPIKCPRIVAFYERKGVGAGAEGGGWVI